MKAEGYNRTTNVDWCFLRWGSLGEAYREPPVLWGEFGDRDCIPSRGLEVLTCINPPKTERRIPDSLPSNGDGNSTANIRLARLRASLNLTLDATKRKTHTVLTVSQRIVDRSNGKH